MPLEMMRFLFQPCFFLGLVSLFPITGLAQALTPITDVKVFQSGTALPSPFAGGVNEPQFSPIDLNGDGQSDLVIFDRSGDQLLPFLADANSSSGFA